MLPCARACARVLTTACLPARRRQPCFFSAVTQSPVPPFLPLPLGRITQITRAVNFFGPALLTHLLLPSLAAAAPARVVNVCSVGEAAGRLRWGPDLRGAGPGAPRADFWAYADAKLCLLVWGRELHRRLRGAGVDVLSVHPGVVHTPGEWKASGRRLSSWLTWLGALVHGQSVRWGATSTLFAATEPRLAGVCVWWRLGVGN